jgi:hypothetical protein
MYLNIYKHIYIFTVDSTALGVFFVLLYERFLWIESVLFCRSLYVLFLSRQLPLAVRFDQKAHLSLFVV